MAIDKYTYFNNLQLTDFIYIIHCLHNSGAITINNDDTMYAELSNILTEYEEE